VQKDTATPSIAHFRLLSDAMEELCSARTQEEVVRISAASAKKACNVDSISVVLTSGEQFHYEPASQVHAGSPGDKPDTISLAIRSKVIMRMSAWALEAAQTAVVPDIHRDERTRLHTNGSTFARSLVIVPVSGRTPFAAITFAWAQERWPAATDVLVLEALARATGLALSYRQEQAKQNEADESSPVTEWLDTAADAEGLHGPERRNWLIVAELQHRMRNVLGLVRSLVRRTVETNASAEEYAAHLEGRISSLARTQAFAMRQPRDGVSLEELVDAELIAHAARDGKVKSAGPPVRLRPQTAETLGMALHELTTNAVKFGALSAPEGHLTITWRNEVDREDPCVRLEWVEEGVPTHMPTHRGFGRDLIERTVPYELRGASRLTFEPDGVRCVIDIPLTRDNVVE
jgi:two-component sensor histidine kinase